MRRLVRTLLLVTLATALPQLVAAAPAHASCAFDERPLELQLEEAPAVFKGRVTAVRNDGVTARFAVEEVWKGPPLPPEIVVHGGPEPSGIFGTTSATSVDRSWTVGVTYLVFPRGGGDRLEDNSCSPTREWSAELAAARPDDARPPTAVGPPEQGGVRVAPWTAALGGVAVVAGVWAVVLAFRRRSD